MTDGINDVKSTGGGRKLLAVIVDVRCVNVSTDGDGPLVGGGGGAQFFNGGCTRFLLVANACPPG